jgi:hypothetical protein
VVGSQVSKEFCRRWRMRDAYDAEILALNADRTLATFGTRHDDAYSGSLTSGGGNLRAQLVYRCRDSGWHPGSPCIASPPSTVSPCSPKAPHEGSGHSLVIECPEVVRAIAGWV